MNGVDVHDDDQRLTRLRALAARLERLPETPDREWMLGEVRARMVDVDTGYPPQPLRPLREPEPPPAAARPAKRAAAVPPQVTRIEPRDPPAQEPSPAAKEPAEDRVVDSDAPVPVDGGHVLWLEDSDAEDDLGTSELPRWRRGLRG